MVGDATSYLDAINVMQARTYVSSAMIQVHLENIEKSLNKLGARAARTAPQVAAGLGSMGSSAGMARAAFVEFGMALGIVGTIAHSLRLGAEMESMQLQFGVMLQNATQGRQLFLELRQFAADTPLEMPEVSHAARTLLQYGVQGRFVIDTLRQLGDVAGGQKEQFERLAVAYGQVIQHGRLMGNQVRIMVAAGFNPLQEMARTTGHSMAFLSHEMRMGRITVEQVQEAFRTATGEGGRFHDMMLKQSQTLGGLWSTLRDEFLITLQTIGADLAETLDLKGWIKTVRGYVKEFVGIWGDIPSGLKGAVGWFAMMLVTLGGVALTVRTVAGGFVYLTTTIGASVGGLMQLAAWAVSPTGLMVLGVVALAASYVELSNKIYENTAAVRLWRREMEIGAQLAKEINRAAGGIQQGAASEAIGTGDPEQRRTRIQELLSPAERTLRGQERSAEALRARLAIAQGGQSQRLGIAAALSPLALLQEWRKSRGSEVEIATIRAELQQVEGAAAGSSRYVQQLRDALRDLDPTSAAQRLTEDIDKLNIALQREIATFGLTKDQVKMYDLAMQGATAAQLEEARGLERRHRIQELTRKFEDPAEAYARQAAELQSLLGEGLSPRVYERAMEHLQEDLAKTAEGAKNTAHSITRLDATLVGSAEHITRLQEYRDMLDFGMAVGHRGHGGRTTPGGRRGHADPTPSERYMDMVLGRSSTGPTSSAARRRGAAWSPEQQALIDRATGMIPGFTTGAALQAGNPWGVNWQQLQAVNPASMTGAGGAIVGGAGLLSGNPGLALTALAANIPQAAQALATIAQIFQNNPPVSFVVEDVE
jgi:tape measure domain-containing protein